MALAIDSQEASGAAHASHTDPLSWSFTNTGGNLLVVGVVITTAAGAPTTPTITYNSVALTQIGTTLTWDGAKSLVALFRLITPATGAHSVSITGTNTAGGTDDILAGAIAFSGADTGTPAGTPVTNSGTGTHATAGLVTAASGNYVLGVGGWGSGAAATADHATTFTLVGSAGTGGDDIQTDIAQSSGAAINAGFAWSASDVWGMIAVEIRAPAGAASQTVLPDADLATTGWSTAPLFSKVNDASDGTVITATLA